MERKAGVLMHISSLPNKRGIGSLGKCAYEFVDFLRESGLKLWQVLPLCPTSYGDSPYQSPSAIAGNPYFIDLDTLAQEGLLQEGDLPEYPMGDIDYGAIFNERYVTLRKAFAAFKKSDPAFKAFKQENAFWLDDYAVFMALKNAHDMQSWETWEDEYRFRTADESVFEKEGEFWKFLQFKFYEQWGKLKSYANENGIDLVGDMPIYVAYDSVDVWSNPKMFLLRDDLSPEVVAGVPPDYFSADGQLWGNPIYNWQAMKEDGYKWWLNRIALAMKLYNVLRIDHFRGFSDYYVIPNGATSAKTGEWRMGPGIELFNTIKRELNNPRIIAEDLGELHDCVRQLVHDTGYPGMKIFQFGLDNASNDFYYKNYPQNCIAYTGTHDNDTTRGWFEALDDYQKQTARRLLDYNEGNAIASTMVQKLFASAADTVIVPMQDFLNLPTKARMNTPSTLGGNWVWRSENVWLKKIKTIKKLCKDYKRL